MGEIWFLPAAMLTAAGVFYAVRVSLLGYLNAVWCAIGALACFLTRWLS